MRKCLMLVCLSVSMYIAKAQMLISPVTFTLPSNPPANTAEWATAIPPFTITASTKPVNGIINGAVQESKILVTIKRNGAKVCGMYTSSNAPSANFNTPTKVWSGANALSLLGQDCTLAPGDYELCVKFVPFQGVAMELSNEVCKPFTIVATTNPSNPTNPSVSSQKFTPPSNVAPINGINLKPDDAKKPLAFRWTPVIPKPATPIKYKLSVWQIKQGQTSTAAIKSNTPVIEREVKDQTQFVKPNLMGDIEMIGNKADLVWNVQALNEQGSVLGSSEPTAFAVSNGGCIIDYTPCVIDSIICKDGNQYKICATFKVAKSGYGASSSSYTAYPTKIQSAQFYDQSNNPIGSPITININKTEGQTYQLCQTISLPVSVTTVKIKFDAQVQTPNTSFDNCVGSATASAIKPTCRCNTCDQITFNLGQESHTFNPSIPPMYGLEDNNHLYLTQPIVTGTASLKVVQVKAEVVDFYWFTQNENCKKCNTNDYYFGNLISGSTNAPGFNPTGTGAIDQDGIPLPSSHEMQFTSLTPTGSSFSGNVRLALSLPPQTTLNCCTDCFRFCIRYTIVFMENGICKTCTKVKCYEINRQHRQLLWSEQLNKCGDPIIIFDGGVLQPSSALPNKKGK